MTVPLNEAVVVAKTKEWGCKGCRLFQYSPGFTKTDRDNFSCTLDPNRKELRNTSYMLEGVGNDKAEIMAVLDLPTKGEDKKGTAASGPSNMTITRNANVSGIDTRQWYFTHVVKCHDPTDKTVFASAAYCSTFLSDEILKVKPKIIIAFGPLAFRILTGKKDADILHFIGVPVASVVAGHACTVYAMMSPGYVTRNDYLMQRYLGHFDQLAKFLRGDESAQVRQDNSNYRIITDVDEAIGVCKTMLEAVEKGRVIDADIETSGLNPYMKGMRLSVVSLSCSIKVGYAIMMNHNENLWTAEQRQRFIDEGLKPLFTHPEVKLRWHNGKFDNQWFPVHCGFWARDPVEDTMLTHYAVDENMEHGLKPLANLFTDMGDYDLELDRALAAQDVPDKPRYDLITIPLLGKYAAQDPVATRKLARGLAPLVEAQDEFIHALAYRALPAFSATLTRVEAAGVVVDVDFTKKILIPYMTAEAAKSYEIIMAQPQVRKFIKDGEAAHRATMKRPKPIEVKRYFEFSLNSPKQLQTLLFDPAYYGHEPILLSKSGAPSTDKEVMQDLAALGSPIAKAIQDFRLDEKMVNSFGQPIVDRLAAQGDNLLLHGQLQLHRTVTGRLSCIRGDQRVLTDRGYTSIEDVDIQKVPGIRVLTHNGRWSPVVSVFTKGPEEMYRVTLVNGNSIVCTKSHVFYTEEGWKALSEITVGGRIYSRDDSVSASSSRNNQYTVAPSDGGPVRNSESDVQRHQEVYRGIPQFYDEDQRVLDGSGSGVVGANSGVTSRSQIVHDAVKYAGAARAVPYYGQGGLGKARRDGACGVPHIARNRGIRILGAEKYAALRNSGERRSRWNGILRGSRVDGNAGQAISGLGSGSGVTFVSHRGEGFLGEVPQGLVTFVHAHVLNKGHDHEKVVLGKQCEGASRTRLGSRRLATKSRRNILSYGSLGLRHSVRSGVAATGSVAGLLFSGEKSGSGDRRVCPQSSSHARTGRGYGYPMPGEGDQADTVHGRGRGERYCAGSENYSSSAVVSITSCGVYQTYDLEVPGDQSYVAEGFVSHNCKDPNLQQIPNKANGIVKRMFVSRYGSDGVFIQIDYSQIELRLLAAMSNDPTLVKVYADDGDVHTTNACMIFGMTLEEMNALPEAEKKRRRTVAKRVGFGIAYGIGGPGIQSTLKSDGVIVTEEEAQGYLDTFFEKYPRVKAWIDKIQENTVSEEYSLSVFGRRRRLEQVRSQLRDVVARAKRQGTNHRVQSSAGDLTMTALTLYDQEVRIRRGDDPRLTLPTVDAREFPVDTRWQRVHTILQVHDMIGVDAHKDVAGEAMERLHWTMENVIDLSPLVWGEHVVKSLRHLKRVPMIAEPEVGPNWRDAHKVKSAKDVPLAMHIATAKQTLLDAHPEAEWNKTLIAAATADYKAKYENT